MTTQWVERGSLGESAHTLISTAFEHACQDVAPANERYGSYEDAIFVAGQFITAMRLYEQDWQRRMKLNPSLLNFSGGGEFWHLLKITKFKNYAEIKEFK